MARIPAILRQRVIEASDGRCAYCHCPEQLMGVTFEVEHIQPRSKGGRTTFENLCLSCPTCNRFKANRISAEDPISNRTARLFRPGQDDWAAHFEWSKDKAQIFGLTPTGRATASILRFNRPQMVMLRIYWTATGVVLDP